jgi:hypothetical protein
MQVPYPRVLPVKLHHTQGLFPTNTTSTAAYLRESLGLDLLIYFWEGYTRCHSCENFEIPAFGRHRYRECKDE